MISQNGYKDDLVGTSWIGEVVDIEDPQKVGRIRVKVYGKFDDLEKESIPWAYPGTSNTAGSSSGGGFHSVPKLGSIVSIKFDNGNIYHPEYFFNQKISEEVKTEISNSYANAQVLVYDTVTEGSLKIFFTEEKGLMIDYKSNQINIKPDNSITIKSSADLNIECVNANIKSSADLKVECVKANVKCSASATIDSAKIELGKGAIESVIKGNTFALLYNTHIHATPVGPSSPPIVPMDPSLSLVSKTL
jgi:hypothetical protein